MSEKPKAYAAWLVSDDNGHWWNGDDLWTACAADAVKFLFKDDADKVVRSLGFGRSENHLFCT